MSFWSWLTYPPETHGEPVAHRLRRARPRPIAEAGEGGAVCIAGKVESIEPLLVAPLTGRPCVYWVVAARELYVRLVSCERALRAQGAPFLLVDDSGRARVIPDGARVGLPSDTRLRALVSAGYGWGAAEPPVMSTNERALYDAMEIQIALTSRVRLNEYVIEPEMTIVVAGHGECEPDEQAAEAGYRDSATRPVVSSTRRAPLLIGLPRKR